LQIYLTRFTFATEYLAVMHASFLLLHCMCAAYVCVCVRFWEELQIMSFLSLPLPLPPLLSFLSALLLIINYNEFSTASHLLSATTSRQLLGSATLKLPISYYFTCCSFRWKINAYENASL